MNKDSHLLFEAYRKINEKFEYFGNSSKSEDNETEHDEKECGKGCTCGGCEKCTEEWLKNHNEEAGEESKKEKGHSKAHYEGSVASAHEHFNGEHEGEALANKIEEHLKKIYGDKYDPKKAEKEISKVVGSKTKSEDNKNEKHPSEDYEYSVTGFNKRGRNRDEYEDPADLALYSRSKRSSSRSPQPKEGDKFTGKDGRKWERVKKADGTLGVRPASD
jgi:hypothetical protein